MRKLVGVSLDVETTGLDALNNEIVQIGAVAFDKHFEPISQFNTYVKPMRPNEMNEVSMEINQISLKTLMKAPSPMEVKSSFIDWFENSFYNSQIFPMGYNYGLDKEFLQMFFGFNIYKELFFYKQRDTFILAQGLIDKGLLVLKNRSDAPSLVYLAKHFNLVHDAHDALSDAFVTLNLYKRLLLL